MWSSLLLLALLGMLNPVRLGVTVLVISRPRPLPNLLAYWAGSLTVGIPALLVPLMVLHFTPTFKSFTDDWASPAKSSTVQNIQIGSGVILLSMAALMTVSLLVRPRQLALLPTPGAAEPGLGPGSSAEIDGAFQQNQGQRQQVPAEGGSALRRLLGRAHNTWENGSLWLTWVVGLLVGPGPDAVLFAVAIIVASGAAFGAQVIAAFAYLVGMLAIVEVILVSYLVAPAGTLSVLRRLHDWSSAHRQHILIAIFAVLGVSMLAHGVGGV